MPKKEMMEMHHNYKGKGWMVLVLGILILANVYLVFLDWATFIGIILVLGGIMKLVK